MCLIISVLRGVYVGLKMTKKGVPKRLFGTPK